MGSPANSFEFQDLMHAIKVFVWHASSLLAALALILVKVPIDTIPEEYRGYIGILVALSAGINAFTAGIAQYKRNNTSS